MTKKMVAVRPVLGAYFRAAQTGLPRTVSDSKRPNTGAYNLNLFINY